MDGTAGLRVFEQQRDEIELVLTDVVMPEMSGKELADRLLRARPALRVLFMSGYTDDEIARHGVLEQGTRFLPKPFDAPTLLTKVRSVLDGD